MILLECRTQDRISETSGGPASRRYDLLDERPDHAPQARFGPFGYYAPDAAHAPHERDALNRLDRLAVACAAADRPARHLTADLAALAALIGHDLVIEDEVYEGMLAIDGDFLPPAQRMTVSGALVNLRSGALTLDCVYGGVDDLGPLARRVGAALRDPADRGRMRLGADGAGLPLLRDALGDPASGLSESHLRAAPDGVRAAFFGEDGAILGERPLVADIRTVASAETARLLARLLRLHNRFAGAWAAAGIVDAQERFRRARRDVLWHVQWLAINRLLPALCGETVAEQVLAAGAPIYSGFATQTSDGDLMTHPLPLEYVIAAAPLCAAPCGDSSRAALRLGHRLNLPSGQDLRAAVQRQIGAEIPSLERNTLTAGALGAAIGEAGFAERTPLPAYLQREAEVTARGRLGPLGARIVAETLAGVILSDPGSYWRRTGASRDRRWSPQDALLAADGALFSMEALARAAG